jgi:hypothetical protein
MQKPGRQDDLLSEASVDSPSWRPLTFAKMDVTCSAGKAPSTGFGVLFTHRAIADLPADDLRPDREHPADVLMAQYNRWPVLVQVMHDF